MSFTQTKIESWPSHDARPIAVIRPEPTDLRATLGISFVEDRDDLDELSYAGLLLPGGDQVLLLRHHNAPKPGTEVYGDAGADSARLLTQFLSATGLSVEDVSWQVPRAEWTKAGIEALTRSLRAANQGDFSVPPPRVEGWLGGLSEELDKLLHRLRAQAAREAITVPVDPSPLTMLQSMEGVVADAVGKARAVAEMGPPTRTLLQLIKSLESLRASTLATARQVQVLEPRLRQLVNASAQNTPARPKLVLPPTPKRPSRALKSRHVHVGAKK